MGERLVESSVSSKTLLMSKVTHPTQMWVGAFQESGAEEMKQTLQWESPPLGARWGETVFAFFLPVADVDNVVGWASVKRDPTDVSIMEVVRWVRPKRRREGHAAEMLRMVSDLAFDSLGASLLFRNVFDDNVPQLRRCLRDAERGPWVHAGRVWYPSPYHVFALSRDSWEALR